MRVILIVVMLGASGCASHVYGTALASHTLENGQADVVWLLEDGVRPVRCANGPERPVCVRAEVR